MNIKHGFLAAVGPCHTPLHLCADGRVQAKAWAALRDIVADFDFHDLQEVADQYREDGHFECCHLNDYCDGNAHVSEYLDRELDEVAWEEQAVSTLQWVEVLLVAVANCWVGEYANVDYINGYGRKGWYPSWLAGLPDTSWDNDSCDSVQVLGEFDDDSPKIKVWIEQPHQHQRETENEHRFTVCFFGPEQCCIDRPDAEDYFDDPNDLFAYLLGAVWAIQWFGYEAVRQRNALLEDGSVYCGTPCHECGECAVHLLGCPEVG